MCHAQGVGDLAWDVYSGVSLEVGPVPSGWAASACDEAGLARLLHETGEPVTCLVGRAELGPRALGNRSILAAPVRAEMKDRLNEIKGRAPYRPVAPVCLESEAPAIFDPGTPDPYMLFDHRVRPEWVNRIPAVLHVDGTARLQTVNAGQNPIMVRVLEEYRRLSGIPVLCNTSANLKGRGFFPDVASAVRWGGTRYVWSDGVLYRPAGDRTAELVVPASATA
jgi:carbamoyltransferase